MNSSQSSRLILFWRHAQAVDASEHMLDMARPLTKKGLSQAQYIARWLRQSPFASPIDDIHMLCSPAVRAIQTMQALKYPYTVRAELAPEADSHVILKLIERTQGNLLLVGHEPWISEVIANLLGLSPDSIEVKKGSLWGLASLPTVKQEVGNARTKYRLLCAQLPITD